MIAPHGVIVCIKWLRAKVQILQHAVIMSMSNCHPAIRVEEMHDQTSWGDTHRTHTVTIGALFMRCATRVRVVLTWRISCRNRMSHSIWRPSWFFHNQERKDALSEHQHYPLPDAVPVAQRQLAEARGIMYSYTGLESCDGTRMNQTHSVKVDVERNSNLSEITSTMSESKTNTSEENIGNCSQTYNRPDRAKLGHY